MGLVSNAIADQINNINFVWMGWEQATYYAPIICYLSKNQRRISTM